MSSQTLIVYRSVITKNVRYLYQIGKQLNLEEIKEFFRNSSGTTSNGIRSDRTQLKLESKKSEPLST